MPNVLRFTVLGTAQPKGSTRAFIPKGWKRAIVTSDNPKNKGWQQAIAASARLAMIHQNFLPLSGPVAVAVQFYLPRPKAIKDKDVPHVKKPDLDKLVRCLDALTKVVWDDDSQVTSIAATKAYAAPGEAPWTAVTVRVLS